MTFSATQVKKLSDKLDSAHVRTRRNRGMELVYIEGWHAISEANRIFGYDAWDRQTLSAKCVWTGKTASEFSVTYTARVRIRVRAGSITITREGCGTGEGTGTTSGEAHDIALKAAETDATKRALATFGNPFGLALYDRSLSGVRRPGRIQRQADKKAEDIRWTFKSADGQDVQELTTPLGFAEALKAAIEETGDVETLFQIWEQNSHTVRTLHRLPGSQQAPISAKELSLRFKERAIELARTQSQLDAEEAETTEAAQETSAAETNGHSIDKSALTLGAPKRFRSREHLKYVAAKSCLICGRRPSQAHHIRFAQPRALGRKVSDEYVVPLCSTHHNALHRFGDEKHWWMRQAIDPLPIAKQLWNDGQGRSAL